MIGIIIWLLLIIVIVCCSVPSFGLIILTLIGMAAVVILILWLLAKLTNKRAEETHTDREKAIDEWERKWGKKHPSRK